VIEFLIGLVIGIALSWWWHRGNLKPLVIDAARWLHDFRERK
jgi:hypothetical protein